MRYIEVGLAVNEGLNFHEFFKTDIVDAALEKFFWEVRGGRDPCYCLEFLEAGHESHFRPLGRMFCLKGTAVAPGKVPLCSLVPDYWKWPTLRLVDWTTNGTAPEELTLQIDGVNCPLHWHGQVRLQTGERYVGYLKVAGVTIEPLPNSPLPNSRDFLGAFYATKLLLMSMISYRRVELSWNNPEFQQRLHVTRRAIEEAVRTNPRLALRHVADMLTSHLGPGWNRAACYVPFEGGNLLRCLYAQGGDASPAWSDNVQRPIGEHVDKMETLAELAQACPQPADDRYRETAASERWPVELHDVLDPANWSAMALLWKNNGNVMKLPTKNREWNLCTHSTGPTDSIDRCQINDERPPAAVFGHDDPWVDAIRHQRPDDPIFVSRNGKYWAIPWTRNQKIMAIWLVDLAYWAIADSLDPAFPPFSLTQRILYCLAPYFEGLDVSAWADVAAS